MTIMWLAIFKNMIYQDQNNLDYVWRIIIGVGGIPALASIYFRLAIAETPRYTMEIHDDIETASKDVDNHINRTFGKNYSAKTTSKNRGTFKDFFAYFKQWKHFKVLLGTSVSWFCLDIGFYGILLDFMAI